MKEFLLLQQRGWGQREGQNGPPPHESGSLLVCWVRKAAGATKDYSIENLPLNLLLLKRAALRASALD